MVEAHLGQTLVVVCFIKVRETTTVSILKVCCFDVVSEILVHLGLATFLAECMIYGLVSGGEAISVFFAKLD